MMEQHGLPLDFASCLGTAADKVLAGLLWTQNGTFIRGRITNILIIQEWEMFFKLFCVFH